jgi:drug/metabolite transporter (DMT)-like permease
MAPVVLAVLPLLTAMAGAAVAGERPSIGFWACGVAGTGAVFVYALLSGAGASQVHWADLLLAGAALCASMAYALGGELGRRIGGWEVISWALVFSSPVMLVLLALFAWPIRWDASLSSWAGLHLCVRVQHVPRFLRLEQGLAMGGIARISQMQLLQPFVGLLAAWAFVGRAHRLAGGRLRGAGGGTGGHWVGACAWRGRPENPPRGRRS